MLETALTPTFEQTLNLIISSLANFFGTTTEKIMENAPYWLAKYGWYKTLRGALPDYMLSGLLFGIIVLFGFLMIWDMTVHNIKPLQIIISIFLFVLVFLLISAIPIITCIIAPEIVGLEEVIKLLK